MEYEKDDLLLIDDVKYIVLCSTMYNELEYYFVNKLSEEENPTAEFYIMKIANGLMLKEEDKNILESLNNVFSSQFQSMLDEYRKTNNEAN